MNPQNTEGKDGAESMHGIKRYCQSNNHGVFDEMREYPDGLWVKFSDVESELTRLREEIEELKGANISLNEQNEQIRAEAKPMTVEELRAEFEKEFKPEHLTRVELEGDEWDYERNFVFERWLGFLACARLLGRVKE